MSDRPNGMTRNFTWNFHRFVEFSNTRNIKNENNRECRSVGLWKMFFIKLSHMTRSTKFTEKNWLHFLSASFARMSALPQTTNNFPMSNTWFNLKFISMQPPNWIDRNLYRSSSSMLPHRLSNFCEFSFYWKINHDSGKQSIFRGNGITRSHFSIRSRLRWLIFVYSEKLFSTRTFSLTFARSRLVHIQAVNHTRDRRFTALENSIFSSLHTH